MSPVLTAPVEAPPAPPERPGYFAVVVATFLGYLWTLLIGLPVVLVGIAAGLDPADSTGSVGRGLFYRYDFWSWAAEASAGLLAVGATTVMVGHVLRARTGWEVSFGATFLTLAITGYAPLVALTPLYGAPAIASLLIAAFVLGALARPSGAEPMTALGQVPRRYRRRVAIALAVGVPLMIVYVLGYAATHPLRYDAVNTGPREYDRAPGSLVWHTFDLRHLGSADVSELSVVRVEGSPGLQLERAGVLGKRWLSGESRPLLSLQRFYDEAEGDRVTLELRHGTSCPGVVGSLDALWIRYTVLGMRHEQRVPLVDGPSVRCR